MDFMDFVECTYVNDLEFDSQFNTYPKGSRDAEQSSDSGDSDISEDKPGFEYFQY